MSETEKKQIDLPLSASLRGNKLSRLGNWRIWVSIILLFLVLEIAILSIERARWINPQPSFTLILVLSIALAWYLAGRRLPGIVTHIIALAVGIAITAWQTYQMSSSDTIGFAIFLAFLTWVTGYLSTWFILRRSNAWVAVCVGTLIVIVNLSNLPSSYYYFFGLYSAAVVFLIIWIRIIKQNNVPGYATGFTKRSLFLLSTILLCIIFVTVSFARIIPDMRIPQLQTFVATKMLWIQDLEDSFLNLFAEVPSKQPLNTSSTRQDLAFGPVWKEKEQVDFVILSPQPSYWRIKVYDTYTSQGWTNRPVVDNLLAKGVPWEDADATNGGETITYTVMTNIKTDAMLTAGNFVSSDTSVLVSVIGKDLISVATPRVLSPGEHYTVTSTISSPSSEALSLVGEDYPSSVAFQYTRLPANFPDEIKLLSKDITSDAKTPYQKVTAIDNYLSQFPYTQEIEPPPEGADGVQYFLYTQKSGFCLYFASAMVVMLRSVDVPARLAIGYVSGEFGENEGEYILLNKHYHAWAQVYFTGYGWVDIEATPSSGSSPVNIETPFVSSVTNPENPTADINLRWQTPEYLAWLYGIPLDEPAPDIQFSPGASSSWGGLNRALLILIIAAGALFLLFVARLAFRSVFYRWLWRVDREHLVSRVYSRMFRLASIVGLEPKAQQTPQEFANELAIEFPDQAAALDNIVRFYTENKFSPRKGRLKSAEEAVILNARHGVYTELLQRLGLVKKLLL
jgi:transglutaminase-like putative cysteine protease